MTASTSGRRDDGKVGHGIFELLAGSDSFARYRTNWPPMDMTTFRQKAR